MSKINYKSDFDFTLRIYECTIGPDGQKTRVEMGFPTYDFEIRLYTTNRANAYICSKKGNKLQNCFNDEGKIHVVCDNHYLGKGILHAEFTAFLPNNIYPDGSRKTVEVSHTVIELVDGSGDSPSIDDLKLTPAYVSDQGEAKRVEAENKRVDAEAERKVAEAARTDAEAQRVEAEAKRNVDEAKRIEAENKRKTTEAQRAEGEASRDNAEAQRGEAEAQRVAAEQSREQAEANRTAAESQRAETFAGWREVIEGSGSATSPTYSFDAQWTAAGGTVITPGKVYECNGTDDLTYAEAIDIYGWHTNAFVADSSYRFEFYPHRALLPVAGTNEKNITADRMFTYAKTLKVIKFRDPAGTTPPYVNMTRPTAAFMRCEALREIDTPIQFTASPDSAFSSCAALEEVHLYKLAYNVSFDQSPILSLASLQYLVENATNTKTITVTVHPDVYAKLTGDITNAAAAALTAEELAQWQQVMTDAMAKNISFATI